MELNILKHPCCFSRLEFTGPLIFILVHDPFFYTDHSTVILAGRQEVKSSQFKLQFVIYLESQGAGGREKTTKKK